MIMTVGFTKKKMSTVDLKAELIQSIQILSVTFQLPCQIA